MNEKTMAAMTEFINRLYPYCVGKIEIRILPGRRQFYFNKKDVGAMFSTFRKYKKSQVYFGVATRDGFGGTKENIVEIPAIWCDVDYKDITRKQLAELYRGFPFKPTIIIKSGGGVHFYWCLSEPVGQNEIPLVEDVNKRIASALGGDIKTCNAATVLRPPGTYNNKPEYDPPPMVKMTEINQFEYELDRFLDTLPESPHTKANGKSTNPKGWLVEALKGVAEHDPGRDATGTKIAGYFINKLLPSDVATILTAWNYHNQPPLNQNDIIRIVDSVSRYRKTNNGAPHEQKRIKVSFS